jgi:hypothetical protein
MLYEMIPGWTETDAKRAVEMTAASDPMLAFAARLNGDAV